jgi:hypothetical protein
MGPTLLCVRLVVIHQRLSGLIVRNHMGDQTGLQASTDGVDFFGTSTDNNHLIRAAQIIQRYANDNIIFAFD